MGRRRNDGARPQQMRSRAPSGNQRMTPGGAIVAALGVIATVIVITLVVAPRTNRLVRDRFAEDAPGERPAEEGEL